MRTASGSKPNPNYVLDNLEDNDNDTNCNHLDDPTTQIFQSQLAVDDLLASA